MNDKGKGICPLSGSLDSMGDVQNTSGGVRHLWLMTYVGVGCLLVLLGVATRSFWGKRISTARKSHDLSALVDADTGDTLVTERSHLLGTKSRAEGLELVV